MAFEGHFGDPLSNLLVPLNIFRVDEATHLKFDMQIVFGKPMEAIFLTHRHVHIFARPVSDS